MEARSAEGVRDLQGTYLGRPAASSSMWQELGTWARTTWEKRRGRPGVPGTSPQDTWPQLCSQTEKQGHPCTHMRPPQAWSHWSPCGTGLSKGRYPCPRPTSEVSTVGTKRSPSSPCLPGSPDPNPSPSRPSFQGPCGQRTREGHGPGDDGRGSQGQGWASSVSRSPSFHQATWALS